ncbi:MAG: hypothetical protein C5B50_28015 [Verrucomicrobia bacterium]|nr:MAG: hypothetical protein C5B50_28015 [Verrucomicrobiota bacterium]
MLSAQDGSGVQRRYRDQRRRPGTRAVQTPNTKHQTPEKHQASNTKYPDRTDLRFGVWSFSGVWCLVFGVLATGPLQAAFGEPVEKLYNETLRPQFHFTAKKGWLNDPNGLVFYKGDYHLFFQHIPVPGTVGGQIWGHAVSRDLVHWEQLANAIDRDRHGPIWSGSAVVDWQNTAGLAKGSDKTLIAIYTCAGGQSPESKGEPFTQCLAYSNDRGRSWTKYENNPVLQQITSENRDPKVIWYEPTHKWILVLYKTGHTFGLFSSPDLKTWSPLHDLEIPDGAECPDIFEMPLNGKASDRRWIITSANGRYTIGQFDGAKFTKESGPHRVDWGKNFYAVQTFSDIPKNDGRRIQIAWMAWAKYPNMPFDQQMSFPCELTLHSFPEGPRICRQPVKEIALLHCAKHSSKNQVLRPGDNLLAGLNGELFDIQAEIDLDQAAEIGFKLRGEDVRYSVVEQKLSCLGQSAPINSVANHLKLRILLDRTSLEVFANDGRASLSSCFVPDPSNRSLAIYARAGPCRVRSLSVWELRSAWAKN